MANSTRRQILEYLKDTTIPLILTASGYTQDIATVERGIRNIKRLANEEFGAVFIPGAKELREDHDKIHFMSTMSVFLGCFVKDPTGSIGGVQALLDDMIEDVTKALYSDETLGGLALNLTVTDVDPQDADDGINGFVLIQVDIQYEGLKATP